MDEVKLQADVQALYEGIPAYEGLPHAKRVLTLAQRLMASYPCQPLVVTPACLFHSVASLEMAARGAASAIIAGAYLRGVGESEDLIQQVGSAIRATDWSGAGEDGQPMSNESLLLWHACQLDTLSIERHVDFLAEIPLPERKNGRLSYEDRSQRLAAYQRQYVMAMLSLRARFWLPGSVEFFDEMYQQLEEFLDNLAAAHLSRLPLRIHYLIEGIPENKGQLLPSGWRRLREVDVINYGVRRLLAGEDPKAVKAGMPSPGLPYAEFRQEQRDAISNSHDAILKLARQRIDASQRVAAEKYLEGDTIHKPEVEENLFVSARRRGRQLGLSPTTAEDIARLLLAKAREVQEQTLNEIAVKLSRLHREILDAPLPQSRLSEADISIPSLVIRTGDQPLAREDELIKEFRLTGLNEAHQREREAFQSWFENPHHYFVKGLLAGSRDSDLFLQALFDQQRCKVIASFTPAGSAHIGHGALISLLTYFQNLGAEIVISFNDLELLQRDLADSAQQGSKQESLMEVIRRSRTAASDLMQGFLVWFAAMGLDLERVDAYSQLSRQEVLELAFELGSKIKVGTLNSAFGLSMDDSATSAFLPLAQVADILHSQLPGYGGPCRTLVISGLERDVYVRMARNIAEEFKLNKPSALYLRMVRSLSSYEDPQTGAPVEVMKGSIPQGAIFYDDDASTIRRKIRYAVTGGRKTQEEQRRLGGNPDPRICSVSSLQAFHGLPDPAEYQQLQSSCRAGNILCGDCKARASERTVEYVTRIQENRHALRSSVLQRRGCQQRAAGS